MEWISVKDRLPEVAIGMKYTDMYLVVDDNKDMYVSFMRGSNWFVDTHKGTIATEDGLKITHWAPLPKPPKEPQ